MPFLDQSLPAGLAMSSSLRISAMCSIPIAASAKSNMCLTTQNASGSGSSQFQDLLNKSWMQDGDQEHGFRLLRFLGTPQQSVAERLVRMPFLDSVEKIEADTLGSLRFDIASNQSEFKSLLDRPGYADGLTDESFAEAMELLRRLVS